MASVRVATTSMKVVFDKVQNVQKIEQMTRQAAANGAKLVMFPETAVQGYLFHLVGPLTTETIRYQQKNAEVIPEGETTQKMVQLAKECSIYIIYGMVERDKYCYDVLYNTAVLVGPEGFVGTYRKVHQPIDEKHVYTPGDDFPVYETSIGRIGMQICMDKHFPEPTRELVLRGAEITCVLAAWEDFIGDVVEERGRRLGSTYDLYDCVRADENQIWLMSSNHVGGTFCGSSNIVDPNGLIIATTGREEEAIAYADIDVRGGILDSRAVFLQTWVRECKPNTYKAIASGFGIQGRTSLQTRDHIDPVY